MKSFLLPAILSLAFVCHARAATIVYEFGDTIAFATNLGAGSPVTSNGFSGDGITSSNWTATQSGSIRSVGVQGGQVRALKDTGTDIHTFTVTIPTLVSVDFTNLSFTYGNVGGDTAPANITVSSNVSGGTFSQDTWTHTASTNFSGTANITLGGNFLSDLTNRTVTFTFSDAAQGNNSSTGMYTFIDNVTLTGTVIPEPGAALLGSLGLLALLHRRRA